MWEAPSDHFARLEDLDMNALDFSPLFRSTIGFDRMMRLADAATRLDAAATSYPPYNIEKTGDDAYRLTMAVAGFGAEDIELTVHENALLVKGKGLKEEDSGRYLHRGIARRAFERRFQLADHIKVVGASLDNGLLHVELVREVPEAAKPRTIAIQAGAPAQPKAIDQQQQAA
jgi:molecular chaperone IbpA